MFKVLDTVCKPTRATKYSAMVDLYARENVVIGAGDTKIVPLGVKIDKGSIKDSLEDWEHIGGFMESYIVTGKQSLLDRKSTRLNSSHITRSRMPSSA